MTIVLIIMALLAGAVGGLLATCIMSGGACDDAFRAGYQAGKAEALFEELKWGGNEGAGDD